MASQLEGVSTIFVVGPTASGKSELAMRLAEELDGEIICADSQTIRRGMDIGTAKPTAEDQARVPHHLLDIIDPYQEFSLAQYLEVARRALDDIHSRGKRAIVVGGTGLYIDALYYQFQLPKTMTRDTFDFESSSIPVLQDYIKQHDLVMPTNDLNKRHLINVILRDGDVGSRNAPLPNSLIVGINPGREVLIERINRRVDVMFDGGFIDEVKQLIKIYGQPPREFDAIGYKIAMKYLNGVATPDEAKAEFKLRDRQYAKRQISWLKRNPDIKWFESAESAYLGIMS